MYSEKGREESVLAFYFLECLLAEVSTSFSVLPWALTPTSTIAFIDQCSFISFF